MPLREAVRWERLRPTTAGVQIATVAAGFGLALAAGTAINMVLLTGNQALGATALVAYVYTLQLMVLAALAVGLAVLAWKKGAPLAGLLLGGTAVVLVSMSVVPVNAQWARAREYDVGLSVREYLRPTYGSGRATDPHTVATADGGQLTVNVWEGGAATGSARPAIVLIHGGAWIGGAPGGLPAWNQHLPDLGFVVLDITYRVPVDVPQGWRPELQVGDVKCAMGWARSQAAALGIDPERISAMGHSAGGHLALLAAYTAGDPALPPTCAVPDVAPRSVISIYGPTDLRGMWDRSPTRDDLQAALREYIGGSPTDLPELYALLSPTTHVKGSVPPTLSIIGESDQIVPVDLVREMAVLLDDAGATHEEYYLPGTDHIFDASWGAFNTQITRAKVTDFLRAHA